MEEYIDQAIKVILIPLLPLVSGYLILYFRQLKDRIREQSDNELIEKYLDLIDNMVYKKVWAVNQIFVDALKKEGIFTKEKQNEAFQIAKNKVLSNIDAYGRDILREVVDDWEEYIDDLIEAYVIQIKESRVQRG